MAERPYLVLPDVEQLVAIAEALRDVPPDEQEWRRIIEGVVDHIVIKGHDIEVEWKPTFKPFINTGTN